MNKWLCSIVLLWVPTLVSLAESTGEPHAESTGEPHGVVVESVGAGTALEKAGIQPGDVLLRWKRLANPPANPEAAEGVLDSYFDWQAFVVEQVPRGPVVLTIRAEQRDQIRDIGPGDWEAGVNPFLSSELTSLGFLEKPMSPEQVEKAIQFLGAPDSKKIDEDLRTWLLFRLADELTKNGAAERAVSLLKEVEHSNPSVRASILHETAEKIFNLTRFDEAAQLEESACKIYEVLPARELSHARCLRDLGVIRHSREPGPASQALFEQAAAFYQQFAPGSLAAAWSKALLGIVMAECGNFETAAENLNQSIEDLKVFGMSRLLASAFIYSGNLETERGSLDPALGRFQQALEVLRVIEPGGLDEADALNNLGGLERNRGRFTEAEIYFRLALEIREAKAPGELLVAESYNNLASIANEMGDLDKAFEYLSQAYEIKSKKAEVSSPTVVLALINLGALAVQRGDHASALDYLSRGRKLIETWPPSDPRLPLLLNVLGESEVAAGNLDSALELHERALAIQEEMGGPHKLSLILGNLGKVRLLRGDLDEALRLLLRALDMQEKEGSSELLVSTTLHNIGMAFERKGVSKEARKYYLKALDIDDRLLPSSISLAVTLQNLASLAYKSGDLDEAWKFFGRAIEVMEKQVRRVGASRNLQAGYRFERQGFYDDAVELLLSSRRFEKAFELKERFRAQSLVAMLAERRSTIWNVVPSNLQSKSREVEQELQQAFLKLSALDSKDVEEVESLRTTIGRLESERSEIDGKILLDSPRSAALRDIEPLGLAQVGQILDRDTRLVSFSVHEKLVAVFTVSSLGDLRTEVLSIGRPELGAKVMAFRTALQEAGETGSLKAQRELQLRRSGRELYDLLLRPVEASLEPGSRLVIVPDGPLHYLPFDALIRTNEEGEGQYLVEWKSVHLALSAKVYAELLERRNRVPRPDGQMLVAFGDPSYPSSRKARTDVESGIPAKLSLAKQPGTNMRNAFDLKELPYSRSEIAKIAGLFAGAPVRTFLGSEALEEQVKNIDPNTRILHIAAHANTDERLPMSSFIALSIPDDILSQEFDIQRDDGLLQVWEIFEKVRVDADLVVLSACETGLGKDQGGEGLIGLTRAFQYAGARSVLASLWNVADATTAELMVRFYRHLRSGLTKDEALRAAQLELIRGPITIEGPGGTAREFDASSPYYWAAFQLYGDWQ